MFHDSGWKHSVVQHCNVNDLYNTFCLYPCTIHCIKCKVYLVSLVSVEVRHLPRYKVDLCSCFGLFA